MAKILEMEWVGEIGKKRKGQGRKGNGRVGREAQNKNLPLHYC